VQEKRGLTPISPVLALEKIPPENSGRVRRCFLRALGLCPITKSVCSPIVGRLSCIYVKRFLRGLFRERIFWKSKPREKNG
jgi:hypothetical protein